MSITALQATSSNGRERKPDGVRTYRGKSLAELIPQIREELGPDAIILREREGLIGGVSGFFAKRCVEVEARGATPRIDVYDDDEDEVMMDKDEETRPRDAEAEAAHELRVEVARRADEARRRRVEAMRAARELDAADEPETADDHDEEPAHTPQVAAKQGDIHPLPLPTEATDAAPSVEIAPWSEIARESLDHVIADQQSFADQLLAAQEPSQSEDEEPAADIPQPVPAEPPAPAPEPRRAPRKLPVPAPRAKRAQRFDAGAAASIGRELVGQGISQTEAARLVSEAAAHSSPFASRGGLRGAVRRALAIKLARPVTPPSHGAAVAVVGAGGAGKTTATAALSAAYGRASTLSVTAVSLGGSDRGRALKALLKPERVDVKFAAGATKAVIQRMHNRTGAMIVVDTAAAASGNRDAVIALASELGSLSLDAVYVAVPATLGAPAARQLLERLAPLSPTGIVITHADETDQLGVAVELSCSTGIPVAYVLEGASLDGALSAPDPVELASRLLP